MTTVISKSDLQDILTYDPETGVFVSKVNRGRITIGAVVGTRRKDGYVKIVIKNRQYYAHRLAWLYSYGDYPAVIKHIDGKRFNNRLTNLKLIRSI